MAIEVYREAGDVYKIVSTATRYDGVSIKGVPGWPDEDYLKDFYYGDGEEQQSTPWD